MHEYLGKLAANWTFWVAVGLVGQAIFASRFLVQWYVSEKRRESTIPVSFWYISIAGSILVMAYGIAEAQLPVILGQFGLIVYVRNLMLIRAGRAQGARGQAAPIAETPSERAAAPPEPHPSGEAPEAGRSALPIAPPR
mgnify:CR=1 FL=1